METTFDGSQSANQNAAERAANDFKGGAKTGEGNGANELRQLIADVEELLARVASLKDSESVRIRTRVENALANAKQSLVNTTATVKTHARQVATSADTYVRESPWQALGIAALAGVAIGLLASRR